jgi:hypothetical protein
VGGNERQRESGVDDQVRSEPPAPVFPLAEEKEDHRQIDDGLQRDLLRAGQAFRVPTSKLEPIIEESNQTVTKGKGENRGHGRRAQVAEGDGGHRNAEEDQHPAHGGRAAFLSMGLGCVFAHVGATVLGKAQAIDQLGTDEHSQEQRRHSRGDDPERRIPEEVEESSRACSTSREVEQVKHQ